MLVHHQTNENKQNNRTVLTGILFCLFLQAICAGIGASTSATALAASTIKSLSVKEITFMKNVAGGSDPSRVPTCGTWTGSTQGTVSRGSAAEFLLLLSTGH
jgi:hypothetical protein